MLIQDPKSNQNRWLVYMMAVDLKYMARPAALPIIASQTDFID